MKKGDYEGKVGNQGGLLSQKEGLDEIFIIFFRLEVVLEVEGAV
jgi:hypothetical protein